MTTTETLTPRQAEIVAAITRYWADHGCSPTIRELFAVCRTKSTNGVTGHLRLLAAKGVIEWPRGKTARGIWPAGKRQEVMALFRGTP